MRLFGHPVHPLLVHFPIVLWTLAAGAYVAAAAGFAPAAELARLGNGAGLAMAVLAMIAGGLELRRIDARSEAMRVATQHMMAMATVWMCFVAALLLTPMAAAAAAALGFCLIGVGGWLGGRLVYEFGVGVRPAENAASVARAPGNDR